MRNADANTLLTYICRVEYVRWTPWEQKFLNSIKGPVIAEGKDISVEQGKKLEECYRKAYR